MDAQRLLEQFLGLGGGQNASTTSQDARDARGGSGLGGVAGGLAAGGLLGLLLGNKKARKKVGNAKWRRRVHRMIDSMRVLVMFDRLYIGGGNAKQLKELPAGTRLGHNRNAFAGGFRLWKDPLAGRRTRLSHRR